MQNLHDKIEFLQLENDRLRTDKNKKMRIDKLHTLAMQDKLEEYAAKLKQVELDLEISTRHLEGLKRAFADTLNVKLRYERIISNLRTNEKNGIRLAIDSVITQTPLVHKVVLSPSD